MFKFSDSTLSEQVERHSNNQSIEQATALILSLIESTANQEMAADKKLKAIETSALALAKLRQQSVRFAVESGELVSRQECLDFLRMSVAVMGQLIRENVNEDTYHSIVDSFQGRLLEAMKQNDKIVRLLPHD